MLLPLLGACAVVGPFQGPEWEPVRGLLSQSRSCRDPRCCGNLIVLCLFLIWQVRHCWHHFTRLHPSKRNAIKVPRQRKVAPSVGHEASFGLAPELFSPGQVRGLDTHILRWPQEQRWGSQRGFPEPGAQHLFSPQHLSRGPPWGADTPSETIFCTSSFPSTCLLTQDSSREAWRVPWCLQDGQTHSVLETCQRIERLLVHFQEKLVPLEHVLGTRSGRTSTTVAISLPNSPSAHNLQFRPRECLPDTSNQQVGVPIWKSWESPQETWAPWSESRTEGREYSAETQDAEWTKLREGGGGEAVETQAPGGLLSIDFGMEGGAETKALECRHQRGVSETDQELPVPEQENPMGAENRAPAEEPGAKEQREAGGKDPPGTQDHTGKSREQRRCKAVADSQALGWAGQDKSGGAAEIQALQRKNENEAPEGERQAQGLGEQGRTRGENGEAALSPEPRRRHQTGGAEGADTEPEPERTKGHVGGGYTPQTQSPAGVKQEDSAETRVPGCGELARTQNKDVAETQATTRKKEGQGGGGGKDAGKSRASRGEGQTLSRHAGEVRWGEQGLGRGEDAGGPLSHKRKKVREIREADWVVIQAHWWEKQRLVETEIDGKFKVPHWENQNQVGGEHRVGLQAPEKGDQRKGGDRDGTNALAPSGQLDDGPHVETHPAGRKEEQFGGVDKTDLRVDRTDLRALGERNLRVFRPEAGAESRELGGEGQSQLGNEFHRQSHIPKWENQEHTGGTEDANARVCEAEHGRESARKTNGETRLAAGEAGEVGGENGAGVQTRGTGGPRAAGREGGTETGAAGEGSQSHLGSDTDSEARLSERENQEQMGWKGDTETQAPEKRDQGGLGGDEGVKAQRPEREDQGQLEREIGGSCSPAMGSSEQTGGENAAENQASEKRRQREAGRGDVRRIQGLRKEDRRPFRSRVHRKTCSSDWEEWKETGGGNGEEIQMQGERKLRETAGEGCTGTHTPVRDDREQSREGIDGEVQTQGPGNQNETAQIQAVRSQRKHRAEDAGRSWVPRREDRGHVRGDCSGDEGPTALAWPWPPALMGSGYGTPVQGQAVVVNSVASTPCPEMKPCLQWGAAFRLASGEGEYLSSQGTAPAREHRTRVSPACLQAQRRRRRHRSVQLREAYSLMQQPQNPHTLAASSLSCGQPPQAVTARAGALTALTTPPPKWPPLKQSKRLLLESLMRRRAAHLTWGLPRRVLESYLLFNFLGSYSPPWAGRKPGQELPRRQEKHREAQGCKPGSQAPEAPRVPPRERQSSELPTQARALERRGPHRSQPPGTSIPLEKPRRTGTPGGAREPQIQKEAPRAKLPASRTPRPAAESRSWCGPGRVPEPPSGDSRGRKMIRSKVSQMAERAPSTAKTSASRAGQDHWKEKSRCQEASEPPRLKSQPPPYRRSGSAEPAEARVAGRQPSSGSTHSSSFKGSRHLMAASLRETLPIKPSQPPQRARPPRPAPPLSLREPTLLPKAGEPHAGQGSVGLHTAVKRELQPPGRRCAGTALPGTRSLQAQEAPGDPNKALQKPSAPQKLSFMKHLRCFLFQYVLKK